MCEKNKKTLGSNPDTEMELNAVEGSSNGLAVTLTLSQPINPPSIGKIRIIKTIGLFANFILMAASAQTSAALVDLASHFSVTLASISIILTVTVLSHMGGTWVGGVLYSRVNVFALLSVAILGYCIAFGTCVFMPNVVLFFVVSAFWAACSGAIDAVSNSHLMAMWDGARVRDSLMQAMHAGWSAGAMSMGATLNLFLNPELDARPDNATSAGFVSYYAATINLSETNYTTPVPPTTSPGQVQYAFVLFACLGVIPFSLNVILYAWDRVQAVKVSPAPSDGCQLNTVEAEKSDDRQAVTNSDVTASNTDGDAKKADESSGGRLTGLRALVMVVFAVVACVFDVERFTSTFLSSYLFYGLDWSTPDASVAFSVFYAGQFSARLLSVVVSAFVRPIYILLTNGGLILVAVVILGVFGQSSFVPYVTSFLMGVGNSCSFPSLFLWLSSFTPITGLVSASMFLGNLDSLLSPVFGHLIENWWPPFFVCYIVVLCFICLCTLIIGHRVGLRLVAAATAEAAMVERAGSEAVETQAASTESADTQKEEANFNDNTCTKSTHERKKFTAMRFTAVQRWSQF